MVAVTALRAWYLLDSHPSHRLAPGSAKVLGTKAEIFGPCMPASREPGDLVPSHLLPVQLSGLGGERVAEGRLPSPRPHILEAEASGIGRAQKAVLTPFGPSALSPLWQRSQLPPRPGLPGGASARHLD